MVWKVSFDPRAEKKFSKLEKSIRQRIADFIDKKLAKNPREHSKMLVGDNKFYRARIGDYRVIFELKDKELVIILIDIGHRRDIYN
jgi:mRNA interferase RelE/StbE